MTHFYKRRLVALLESFPDELVHHLKVAESASVVLTEFISP